MSRREKGEETAARENKREDDMKLYVPWEGKQDSRSVTCPHLHPRHRCFQAAKRRQTGLS